VNGQPAGWDVSQGEVAESLHSLFKKGQVTHDQRLHFGAWTLAKPPAKSDKSQLFDGYDPYFEGDEPPGL